MVRLRNPHVSRRARGRWWGGGRCLRLLPLLCILLIIIALGILAVSEVREHSFTRDGLRLSFSASPLRHGLALKGNLVRIPVGAIWSTFSLFKRVDSHTLLRGLFKKHQWCNRKKQRSFYTIVRWIGGRGGGVLASNSTVQLCKSMTDLDIPC